MVSTLTFRPSLSTNNETFAKYWNSNGYYKRNVVENTLVSERVSSHDRYDIVSYVQHNKKSILISISEI